eukprot:Sspe_Gene.44744::Locus_21981_Transcript_1_1_Confidence_1.000_Length_1634::g.44744::m.44744
MRHGDQPHVLVLLCGHRHLPSLREVKVVVPEVLVERRRELRPHRRRAHRPRVLEHPFHRLPWQPRPEQHRLGDHRGRAGQRRERLHHLLPRGGSPRPPQGPPPVATAHHMPHLEHLLPLELQLLPPTHPVPIHQRHPLLHVFRKVEHPLRHPKPSPPHVGVRYVVQLHEEVAPPLHVLHEPTQRHHVPVPYPKGQQRQGVQGGGRCWALRGHCGEPLYALLFPRPPHHRQGTPLCLQMHVRRGGREQLRYHRCVFQGRLRFTALHQPLPLLGDAALLLDGPLHTPHCVVRELHRDVQHLAPHRYLSHPWPLVPLSAKLQNEMQRALFLYIVVRQGLFIHQLPASIEEALLVWRDAFFLLYFILHTTDGGVALHIKGYCLPRQGLDEDAHRLQVDPLPIRTNEVQRLL